MNTIDTSLKGINPETQKVINYMSWQRTQKQIVKDFFWLREEIVYDDNWENVIDMISDFRDLFALKEKKVKYVEKLWQLWVSEEDFNKLFPNWLPKQETKNEVIKETPIKKIIKPKSNGKRK
jgi:hypothetical protein